MHLLVSRISGLNLAIYGFQTLIYNQVITPIDTPNPPNRTPLDRQVLRRSVGSIIKRYPYRVMDLNTP